MFHTDLKGSILSAICLQASTTAGPLKSAPVEPPVATVLGTVSVEVSTMWIRDWGMPRAREATWEGMGTFFRAFSNCDFFCRYRTEVGT